MRHPNTFVACRDLRGKPEESGHKHFPVLLSLTDELRTGLAVASNVSLEKAIDLRLESLVEGHQGSKAPRFVTGRDVVLLGEAEEECLDRVAPQARKLLLKLVECARSRTAEARKHLPFAWRRERFAIHAAGFYGKRRGGRDRESIFAGENRPSLPSELSAGGGAASAFHRLGVSVSSLLPEEEGVSIHREN